MPTLPFLVTDRCVDLPAGLPEVLVASVGSWSYAGAPRAAAFIPSASRIAESGDFTPTWSVQVDDLVVNAYDRASDPPLRALQWPLSGGHCRTFLDEEAAVDDRTFEFLSGIRIQDLGHVAFAEVAAPVEASSRIGLEYRDCLVFGPAPGYTDATLSVYLVEGKPNDMGSLGFDDGSVMAWRTRSSIRVQADGGSQDEVDTIIADFADEITLAAGQRSQLI